MLNKLSKLQKKRQLYKAASAIYRVKKSAFNWGRMMGQAASRTNPNANKWYHVEWDDPWAALGVLTMAPSIGLAGWSAGNAISSWAGLDKDSLWRYLLKYGLGTAGLVGGAYLGRWGQIPFNIAGKLGAKVAPKIGQQAAGLVSMAGGMGLGTAYHSAVTGAADKLTTESNKVVNNSPSSTNDAYRGAYDYMQRKGYFG